MKNAKLKNFSAVNAWLDSPFLIFNF